MANQGLAVGCIEPFEITPKKSTKRDNFQASLRAKALVIVKRSARSWDSRPGKKLEILADANLASSFSGYFKSVFSCQFLSLETLRQNDEFRGL